MNRLKALGVGVFSHTIMNIVLPPYRERLASIFMLHRMQGEYSPDSGHSADQLRQALRRLQSRGYRFVSLREIFSWIDSGEKPPRNAVAFTLDDGYADQARIAVPVFAEFGIRSTIFVITDFLDGLSWPWDARVRHIFTETSNRALDLVWKGRTFRYDLSGDREKWAGMRDFREYCKHIPGAQVDRLIQRLADAAAVDISRPPPAYAPFEWDEARRLESENVDFAPHTRNHYMLSGLGTQEATDEIIGSWRRLQQKLADPVPVLAYPTGRLCDITARDVRELKDAGLVGAVTTEPGYVHFDRAGSAAAKRFFVNRFSYPDDIGHVLQYSSKIEFLNMKLRYFIYMRRFGGWRKMLQSIRAQLDLRLGRYRELQDIRWDEVRRLVFVCHGNLCRSPYAEVRARGMRIASRSFGLGVTQDRRGAANDAARDTAAERHVDLDGHVTMAMEDMDLGEHDLVLGMEPWHIEQLRQRGITKSCQLSLTGLWADQKTVIIPDPFGRGKLCFELCFDKIDSALLGIAGQMTEAGVTEFISV